MQLLNNVPLECYDSYRMSVQNDIDLISRTTNVEELNSFKFITLKEASEINKQYKKHENIFQKIMNGEYDVIQNLSFDIIRFAFSFYYNKKPYLSDMTQYLQYYTLKSGAMALRTKKYDFAADCLEHSLQEQPEDITVTEGDVINKINKSKKFKEKINNIIKKHGMKSSFKTKNGKESLSFETGDLFLALHSVKMNVKGKKKARNVWNLEIELNDVYDFTDLREIEQYINNDNNYVMGVVGALANNFAMISTSCNVVNEYNITIKFTIENWKV